MKVSGKGLIDFASVDSKNDAAALKVAQCLSFQLSLSFLSPAIISQFTMVVSVFKIPFPAGGIIALTEFASFCYPASVLSSLSMLTLSHHPSDY
jgi:hypothetical protein